MQQPTKSFRNNLALLLRARFPILYVESFEEERVLAEVRAVASDQSLMRTVRPVHVWSGTKGFVAPDGQAQGNTSEPRQALEWLLERDSPGVFIMLDLHPHLGDDRRPADPGFLRRLREVSFAFQSGAVARVLILVSPITRIPDELEKDITLVDFPLPNEEEIRRVLEDMVATNAASGRIRIEVDNVGKERLAKAARGLTLSEATNAFARAMVDDGVLSNDDVYVVLEEKKQTVRKRGILEFVDVNLDLDDVGGLQNLKRWLVKRNNSWLDEATIEYGIPAPKGVLMTGVPGCGKSLTAKAIAAAWELPLLRLDIGRIFAGLVGSSEQNMRAAIRTAEAAAPCVLWLDEVEKGFSGVSGEGGDGGTSSRVFGTFLTWMQEKTSPVFVIATANNVSRLPPEFLRKGRFDEIFFVDLPTRSERRDIWSLHLTKRLKSSKAGGAIAITDALLDRLAGVTEGYAGAEIEQSVVSALFDAFSERRGLTQEDLLRAVHNMVPLSVTQAEQIAAVRGWASKRAVAATATEDRSGYESAVEADRPAPSAEPSPEASMSRGGRVVDF
ncbi:AAA ATPase central domain protein [Intrasporangium calvum DSM 43043]|uniref:Uncharacterized AAA domain-containing protein ycf46 n=1 Tax=Intrasporangium calvum (strain ATCC 23552 / DSM 43043 / JCM 3097 / NBRC 12989 / NCIMB 10167 / NRRL B-3866 / 7 KIP) TaxID=710696 RepID=E6SC27_INTC7|nr:AAA ATPase central domain protein [Intrasporangium calvum DSM 43043]